MTKLRCIIVGEAWGRREKMFEHAFVGTAGRELALMLAQVGMLPPPTLVCVGCKKVVPTGDCPFCQTRNYVNDMDMIRYWRNAREKYGVGLDNTFCAQPLNNEIELFFGKDGNRAPAGPGALKAGKYVLPEYEHHVFKLWERLTAAKPNLIIPVGNTACWAVLGQAAISKIRGTVQISHRLGLKALPTYHPAAMLRNWALRVIILADLTKVAREYEYPEIRRTERWITTHDHRNGERLTLAEIDAWFAQPATSMAVDLETGYALYSKQELKKMTSKMRVLLSNQISMIGFARDPQHALVIPFMDRNAPGLNYWEAPNDETRAWRFVKRGVQSPAPKIFQNGNFDIGKLMLMGIVPKNCVDDTMLQHHAMYPELLKSLGFLGSIYTDEIAWKQMYSNRETLKRDD